MTVSVAMVTINRPARVLKGTGSSKLLPLSSNILRNESEQTKNPNWDFCDHHPSTRKYMFFVSMKKDLALSWVTPNREKRKRNKPLSEEEKATSSNPLNERTVWSLFGKQTQVDKGK